MYKYYKNNQKFSGQVETLVSWLDLEN